MLLIAAPLLSPPSRGLSSTATAPCHFHELSEPEISSDPLPEISKKKKKKKAALPQVDPLFQLGTQFRDTLDEVTRKYEGSVRRVLGVGGMGAVVEIESADGSRHTVKVSRYSVRDEVDLANALEEKHPGGFFPFPRVRNFDPDTNSYEMTFLGIPNRKGTEAASVTMREVFAKQIGMTGAEKTILKRQIKSAVRRIHSQGYVHRDLSPNNILFHVDPDFGLRAYIADFGISALEKRYGTHAGTPGYTSPNQYRGGPAEFADDDYALERLFFEIDRLPVEPN